jgi:diguanylate cyclase (GGDEF)-like protein/PAS domain S-box-containing protein
VGAWHAAGRRGGRGRQSQDELARLRRALKRERLARQRAQEARAEAEERFHLLTDTTGEAFYRLRFDTMSYDYLSSGIERLTGYTAEEVNSLSFSSLVKSITAPAAGELSRRGLVEKRRRGQAGEFHADYLIVTKGGREKWLADHSFPWLDAQGSLLGSVGILTDITVRKRLEERLRLLATTDHLTGLHNRRYFLELTQRELARFNRYGLAFCLLVIDIDHFKSVNDEHGHMAGDLVLKDLAASCVKRLRTNDLMGRVGGEEFAAVLVESDLGQAASVAERLRAMAEEQDFRVGGREVRVTISVGVAQVRPADDLAALLKRADEAMYEAKRKGRNRVELAETI